MGNYIDAWTDVKGLIDKHYPYPQHQGTTDITEVIEFARLATEHGLTDKQYDALITRAQLYHDKLDRREKKIAKQDALGINTYDYSKPDAENA